MTPPNDDRIAYLAGEDGTSLPANEAAALDALRAELGAGAIWEEPPADLEDQVVLAVSRAVAAEGAAGTPEPDAAPVQRRRSPSLWSRLRARRPAFALSLSLPVLAAAAVAIVLVTSSGTSTPALRFAMVVQGTPLAPGAHGSATLTKTTSGWRIQLSATGLPRRDGTNYYEAWLKNADGVLVPVGTFNDARKVTLWSGVPVTKFRSLTVTQQVANGNPKSSGRKVLTGTIH
ncbi:MAG: anti-sigma factor [Solirubrobacteraceae bacterium]